jgi:hypothetical protein
MNMYMATNNGSLIFGQQGVSNLLTIMPSGNVGIGTTTPTSILNTSLATARSTAYSAGDSTTWADVIIENPVATSGVGMATGIGFIVANYHGNNSVVAGIAAVKTNNISDGVSTDLAFITRAPGLTQAEKMRLTQAGNLGIGTATPTELLTVAVSGESNAFISVNSQVSLERIYVGYLSSGGPIGNINPVQVVADVQGDLLLCTRTNNPSYMAFFTNAGTAAVERMRITSAGNVGIGTANPLNLFTVHVAVNQNIAIRQYSGMCSLGTFNDAGSTPVALNFDAISFYFSSGKVGIGIASPTATLQINAPGVAYNAQGAFAITDSANNNNALWAGYDTTQNIGWIQAITNGTSYRALVLSPNAGGVGIGKIAPGYALDVSGDVNCTGAFRLNGTPLATGGGGITVQSNATGSRAFNTVYQNTTGKPMFIAITVTGSGGTGMSCFTDSTTNPAQGVASASSFYAGGGSNLTCSFWVLPNNYYKVTGASTINFWIEWW